jgi:hypothetical protein
VLLQFAMCRVKNNKIKSYHTLQGEAKKKIKTSSFKNLFFKAKNIGLQIFSTH